MNLLKSKYGSALTDRSHTRIAYSTAIINFDKLGIMESNEKVIIYNNPNNDIPLF